jgi:hypothetical protein
MPVPPDHEKTELNKELLLQTIAYDLLWTVFHVGTVTTLLNGCGRNDGSTTLRPWRHLLSDNNKIMQLALRYGTEIGLTQEMTIAIGKLYDALAAEKLRLAPLVESSTGRSSVDRQQVISAGTAWRHLAKNAKSILTTFEGIGARHLGNLLSEDTQTLLQFLNEAAAGSDRRVGFCGDISLPVLKQMRHQPRIKIEGRCTVMLGERSIAADLKDISVRGIGIVCAQPLPDKGAIVLVLEDGRQLKAKIASTRGDQVGLLLDSRLSYNDPLFRRPTGQHSLARSNAAA